MALKASRSIFTSQPVIGKVGNTGLTGAPCVLRSGRQDTRVRFAAAPQQNRHRLSTMRTPDGQSNYPVQVRNNPHSQGGGFAYRPQSTNPVIRAFYRLQPNCNSIYNSERFLSIILYQRGKSLRVSFHQSQKSCQNSRFYARCGYLFIHRNLACIN